MNVARTESLRLRQIPERRPQAKGREKSPRKSPQTPEFHEPGDALGRTRARKPRLSNPEDPMRPRCKAVYTGSIPVVASNRPAKGRSRETAGGRPTGK